MRLRTRREIAHRRDFKTRLLATGAIFAVFVGGACLAPSALAPLVAAEKPVANAPIQLTPTAVAALPKVPVRTPKPAAPTPTLMPTPMVVPTLSPGGLNVLATIRTDATAQWVRTTGETPLHSGPSDDSSVFTHLPQWSLLEQTDSRPDWLMVQYGGDGDTRLPGPGWVRAADVGAVDAPTIWLSSSRPGSLWSGADKSAQRVMDVPPGALMQVVATEIQGTRVHVRLPGNGRTVPPAEGWIDGDSIARAPAPTIWDLPRAFPDDLKADVRINVPYRTQLDGSDYAGANCGPTVLGMALESFGLNLAPTDLRGQVLNSESFEADDNDAGSYIWALADVAHNLGIQAQGLYDADGSLHHWSVDDIRARLRSKEPVILQVVYRALPGRQDSGYYGDHYIIVTGLLGDQFLYNDPIGGRAANEAPGYDRMMTPEQLQKAMRASDSGYAYSGFALTRQ